MNQQTHINAIKRSDAIISKLGTKIQEAYEKGRMLDYEEYLHKLEIAANFNLFLKQTYDTKYNN